MGSHFQAAIPKGHGSATQGYDKVGERQAVVGSLDAVAHFAILFPRAPFWLRGQGYGRMDIRNEYRRCACGSLELKKTPNVLDCRCRAPSHSRHSRTPSVGQVEYEWPAVYADRFAGFLGQFCAHSEGRFGYQPAPAGRQ